MKMDKKEKKEIKKSIKFIKKKIKIATDPDRIEELYNQLDELNEMLPGVEKAKKWISLAIGIATLVSIVLGIVLSVM